MRFEKQIEQLYAKWSPALLAFCFLLLGEGSEAEETTVEAFHACLSRGLDLDVSGLPAFLFLFAIDAARRATLPGAARVEPVRRLEEALLPSKERSVFALREVMGADDMVVSEITEIPVREVQRVWMNALQHLRQLLHKDFFSGRKK